MKAVVFTLILSSLLISCSNPNTELLDMKNDCTGIYRVEWFWTSDTPKRITGIQKHCDDQDVVLEALLNWEGDSIDMTHRWENDLLTHEFIIKNNKVLLADVYTYDSLGNQLEYHSFMPSKNIASRRFFTNYYDDNWNLIKQTEEDILGNIKSETIISYDGPNSKIETVGQTKYHYTYDDEDKVISKKQTNDNNPLEMTWIYQYEKNYLISKSRHDRWSPNDTARISEWETFKYDQEDNLIEHLMGHGSDTDLYYQYEYFDYNDLPEHIKELFEL